MKIHRSIESISMDMYSGSTGTLYFAKTLQIFYEVNRCLYKLIAEFSFPLSKSREFHPFSKINFVVLAKLLFIREVEQ